MRKAEGCTSQTRTIGSKLKMSEVEWSEADLKAVWRFKDWQCGFRPWCHLVVIAFIEKIYSLTFVLLFLWLGSDGLKNIGYTLSCYPGEGLWTFSNGNRTLKLLLWNISLPIQVTSSVWDFKCILQTVSPELNSFVLWTTESLVCG